MTCVHHWILGAGTAEVPAKCKKCGDERVFLGGVPFEESMAYSTKARPFNTSLAQASRFRAGEAVKKAHGERKHGTNAMYKHGCRCEECRAAKSVVSADYARRKKERASA